MRTLTSRVIQQKNAAADVQEMQQQMYLYFLVEITLAALLLISMYPQFALLQTILSHPVIAILKTRRCTSAHSTLHSVQSLHRQQDNDTKNGITYPDMNK